MGRMILFRIHEKSGRGGKQGMAFKIGKGSFFLYVLIEILVT